MRHIVMTLALMIALGGVALAKGIKSDTVKLPTLQCGMCKRTIESKMTGVNGLQSITVDVDRLEAVVLYNSDKLTLAQIEKKIAALGYDANERKADRRAQRKLDGCCQPGAHR